MKIQRPSERTRDAVDRVMAIVAWHIEMQQRQAKRLLRVMRKERIRKIMNRRSLTLALTLTAPIWAPAIALTFVAAVLFAMPAFGHDWYTELKVPGTNDQSSCCGGKDCAPYPHRFTDEAEEHLELYINGKWWAVPPGKILELGSPDGKAHACCYYSTQPYNGCEAKPVPTFRCVIRPRGSV